MSCRKTLASQRTGGDYRVQPGTRHYVDPKNKRKMVRIGPGAYFVTSGDDEVLAAVLGSCIALCVRDPKTGIGGMNHFMLPVESAGKARPDNVDLRYGAHAMEALINEVLATGCPRSRMEVKVFGGADLLGASQPVGTLNAQFAMDYLDRERMPVAAQDIGGKEPRRVEFSPASGRARVKLIKDDAMHEIRDVEERFQRQLRRANADTGVELF